MDQDDIDKLIDELNIEAIDNLDTWKIGPGDTLIGTIKACLDKGELKPLRISRKHRLEFSRWIKMWFNALGASQGVKLKSYGRLKDNDE